MTGIAHQYALAVFSLAEEANRSEEFIGVLSNFAKSLDENAYKFFAHPGIERDQKMKVVEETAQDSLLIHFLKVLIENDRIPLIDAITMAYKDILDDIHKVMQVKVLSKTPLKKDNINKIKERLSKTYGRTVELETVIDPSIIGGFRLEFEGNIIDETINKQLDYMKSSLLE